MRSANSAGSMVKISRPRPIKVYRRERLFEQLDTARTCPIVWIMGPPSAGKTMLVASYLKERKLGGLWYQVDEGDQDLATVFSFLRLAAQDVAPDRPALPLLTPEYLMDVQGFTRRFFRQLFDSLRRPAVVVFDNYQEVPAESAFHNMMRVGLGEVSEGCNTIIMSRRVPPKDFAYLEAHGRLAVLGWQELRLRDDEAAGIISLRRQTIGRGSIYAPLRSN